MGSLHPILFFAGVYLVALLFSIFIFSSLFYSCNSNAADISAQDGKKMEKTEKPAVSSMAMR